MTTYEERYGKRMAYLMREAERTIEFPESIERLEKGFKNLDEFFMQDIRNGFKHKKTVSYETSERISAVLNVIEEKLNKIKGDSFAE
jgi:hypothetical protein